MSRSLLEDLKSLVNEIEQLSEKERENGELERRQGRSPAFNVGIGVGYQRTVEKLRQIMAQYSSESTDRRTGRQHETTPRIRIGVTRRDRSKPPPDKQQKKRGLTIYDQEVLAPHNRERRRRLRKLSGWKSLSPREFEIYVMVLFKNHYGYDLRLTADGPDEGYDIIGKDSQGNKIVFQCKRYEGKIGLPVVTHFYGVVVHTSAVQGFLVTTSSFTKDAREWCKGKPIELVTGGSLVNEYNKWSRRFD